LVLYDIRLITPVARGADGRVRGTARVNAFLFDLARGERLCELGFTQDLAPAFRAGEPFTRAGSWRSVPSSASWRSSPASPAAPSRIRCPGIAVSRFLSQAAPQRHEEDEEERARHHGRDDGPSNRIAAERKTEAAEDDAQHPEG
jgi:hypothetical protein